MVPKQEQSLLDIMGADVPQPVIPQPVQQPVYATNNNNLIDIMDATLPQQPVISQPVIEHPSLLEAQPPVVNPGIFNFFDNSQVQQHVYHNIVIPVVEVLSGTDSSREGKYTGLIIRAAFEREGPNVYLVLDLENHSGVVLTVIFTINLGFCPQTQR